MTALSSRFDPRYDKPDASMRAMMERYAPKRESQWTLCKVYTPGIGLNMGMEPRFAHGHDFNNDFNSDFGPP